MRTFLEYGKEINTFVDICPIKLSLQKGQSILHSPWNIRKKRENFAVERPFECHAMPCKAKLNYSHLTKIKERDLKLKSPCTWNKFKLPTQRWFVILFSFSVGENAVGNSCEVSWHVWYIGIVTSWNKWENEVQKWWWAWPWTTEITSNLMHFTWTLSRKVWTWKRGKRWVRGKWRRSSERQNRPRLCTYNFICTLYTHTHSIYVWFAYPSGEEILWKLKLVKFSNVQIHFESNTSSPIFFRSNCCCYCRCCSEIKAKSDSKTSNNVYIFVEIICLMSMFTEGSELNLCVRVCMYCMIIIQIDCINLTKQKKLTEENRSIVKKFRYRE